MTFMIAMKLENMTIIKVIKLNLKYLVIYNHLWRYKISTNGGKLEAYQKN